MNGLYRAVVGALASGALMTFGDWLWTTLMLEHRMIFGLIHGLALCAAIGLYLGALDGRAGLGAGVGGAIGLGAAAGFYLLAPLLGYAAMFPMWMSFWIAFAIMRWRFGREDAPGFAREAIVRGLIAAVGSGLAFYAISGIWTQPDPGGPNYPWRLASWSIAFLPGFLALTIEPRRDGMHQ